MRTLLRNIDRLYGISTPNKSGKPLAGKDMATVPFLSHAWLIIENKRIHSFGVMAQLPETSSDEVVDCGGRLVLPAWCDSHTHIVFAARRNGEFVDRINGLSYEEIARRGGGILNSAAKLNAMDESALFDQSLARLHQVMQQGTGAIEIKSGYGLCLEGELKMLRVIRRLKEESGIAVKASFLAAHAYPVAYRENKPAYVEHIIDEMLPIVAREGLADYMDVFCEQGFFGTAETERLLEAGWKYGLKPKIHANQLYNSGGVQMGIKCNAVSVDHLECVGDAEIDALRDSSTIPTLLPGAAFFLGMHYQPARKMIDAGLPVCLASDYNPGSCPSGNIPLLLTLGCTQLRMTPEEVVNSVTVNGAAAMELLSEMGTIEVGKKASLILTQPMDDLSVIPYDYGNNPVARMFH